MSNKMIYSLLLLLSFQFYCSIVVAQEDTLAKDLKVYFYPNGNVSHSQNVSNGNWNYYYPNGAIMASGEIAYKKNPFKGYNPYPKEKYYMKVGMWSFYKPDGTLLEEAEITYRWHSNVQYNPVWTNEFENYETRHLMDYTFYLHVNPTIPVYKAHIAFPLIKEPATYRLIYKDQQDVFIIRTFQNSNKKDTLPLLLNNEKLNHIQDLKLVQATPHLLFAYGSDGTEINGLQLLESKDDGYTWNRLDFHNAREVDSTQFKIHANAEVIIDYSSGQNIKLITEHWQVISWNGGKQWSKVLKR